MKKEFEAAKAEVVLLDIQDVITASAPGGFDDGYED